MYDYYNNYYPDYLMHYGVKGMKWGHRRYTNADGSLNAKGIKKYARAGYAQDSYNSNKTKLGKAYDKVTSAHKYAGDAMYGASSAKANKARAEKYVADKEAAKAAKNTPEAKAARRKTALKVGAAVAGTALAAYGAYKTTELLKNKAAEHSYKTGKATAERYLNEAVAMKWDDAKGGFVPKNPETNHVSLAQYHNTMKYTNDRTKKVGSSTAEAYKYLRNKDGRADITVGWNGRETYTKGHYGNVRRETQ